MKKDMPLFMFSELKLYTLITCYSIHYYRYVQKHTKEYPQINKTFSIYCFCILTQDKLR